MGEQANKLPSRPLRPGTVDSGAWRNYWDALKYTQCEELSIDANRQAELESYRSIDPNIEQAIYPFKNVRLSRADIRWLLATQENRYESGEASNENAQGFRGRGLDLRGADLRQVDLRGLSLRGVYGGLIWRDWMDATPAQREAAAVHLEGANLYGTHVEGAILNSAHLEGAYLSEVHLRGSELNGAFLEGVDFWRAHLEDTFLSKAHLEGANFYKAHLEGAYLYEAHLDGASLYAAHLEGADLTKAHLEGKEVAVEDLERIHKWNEGLPKILPPADLRRTFFDTSTNLEAITIGNRSYGFISLADALWSNVNLAVVKWSEMKMLGDERQAKEDQTTEGGKKDKKKQLEGYENAVRANRQLAVALQTQGLNEDAARFAYRAQKLQRTVARRQGKYGQYLFSCFLDLLAGYGYRPRRSLLWYFIIILGFAATYFVFGHLPLLPDALVFSLTSFHGRGFFPGLGNETSLHNPLVVLAAFEAVVGLLIEISFIATFTQRFFGK
jgi:uncharacterized protein YjbI with pentapeptide repeats